MGHVGLPPAPSWPAHLRGGLRSTRSPYAGHAISMVDSLLPGCQVLSSRWSEQHARAAHRRCTSVTVDNVAVRSGCVLVSMDVREDALAAAGGGRGRQEALQAGLVAAVQAWISRAQLVAQLPAAAPVLLQVRRRARGTKCLWCPWACAWP